MTYPNLNLEAIKKREQAATSGPWHQGDDKNRYERDGEVFTRKDMFDRESWDVWPTAAYPEDAEFVAHAREDIPALVAEVERLEAVLTEIGHTVTSKAYAVDRHVVVEVAHITAILARARSLRSGTETGEPVD